MIQKCSARGRNSRRNSIIDEILSSVNKISYIITWRNDDYCNLLLTLTYTYTIIWKFNVRAFVILESMVEARRSFLMSN